MTEHLSAEARRQQIAEILVTGIFRVLANRAARESEADRKWTPARIEIADDDHRHVHEAEPCH